MASDSPPFQPDEWAVCLKVLAALADDPDAAPDRERERVERLVARVYRRTRRGRRRVTEAERQATDRALIAATGRVRADPVPADAPGDQGGADPVEGALQGKSRRCYICRGRYRVVHHHYHLLCPACAAFNERKRHQRADLAGRRAVVTGGRVKIGHEVALKLLRDGAEVVVTTRFPTEAALRFAAQADFAAWSDRLRVHALDLRSPGAVLAFAEGLAAHWLSLDILVNNAAQTVRRPEGHFAAAAALDHLSEVALPANIRSVLRVDKVTQMLAGPEPSGDLPNSTLVAVPTEPPDRREANSWTARLAEVEPVEVLEVLLVNAAAPFLLIGHLKPLLVRSAHPDRYVVNVAGLDGQFGRPFKTDRHPHVNMSKAALNMITRTSAVDLARDGIALNSVDAGWVTHEGGYSARIRARAAGFVPPLDAVDGAARVYDPIVRGLQGERHSGVFFKDYQPTAW